MNKLRPSHRSPPPVNEVLVAILNVTLPMWAPHGIGVEARSRVHRWVAEVLRALYDEEHHGSPSDFLLSPQAKVFHGLIRN